jgi:hypothetical protein
VTTTAELLPGYYVDAESGAWLTLPWPQDRDALAALPPSLGPGIIRWCESNLVHHLTGRPWRFTKRQKRFIHLWYSYGPDGRWIYRSGVKRGAKGTGKDPFAAALINAELAGPTKLVRNDRGELVGVRHRLPLVQIAANSEAQAADLLRVANAMVPKRTALKYGYDKGITRTILTETGARVELLTSSEKSSEGDPATAVFLNESHHMNSSNGGDKIAEVANRNVTKGPGGMARLLELTNAHEQGGESVAEGGFEAWQLQVSGATVLQDILYDSCEAPPDTILTDPLSLRAGLVAAYSDAPWVDLERITGEIHDSRTSVADTIRFYLNGLATQEDAWVDPRKFDALHRSEVVGEGEQITLFLDCSKSTDATGLVGCRLSDGHVITFGGWQKPHGHRGKDWLAPRQEVDAEVRRVFARYKVLWFGVDPSPATDDETEASYWMPMIDRWHQDFHKQLLVFASTQNAVLFDMRYGSSGSRQRNYLFVETAMQTAQAIDESDKRAVDGLPPELTHDGDSMLRVHVHNARRRGTTYGGYSLGKITRDSSKLVDLAVCMVGARLGRRLVLNSGKLPKPKSGKAYIR